MPATGGRVVEVYFQVGSEVAKGDVLIRLDRERLDNEIAALDGRAAGARDEIEKLKSMIEALDRERDGARVRARAELEEAEETLRSEHARQRADEERRRTDIQAARAEVAEREREADRQRSLAEKGAVPRIDAERAENALRESRSRLERAELPLADGAVNVAQRRVETARKAVGQAELPFVSRRQELELRLSSRQAELDADEKRLANQRLEREACVIRAHVTGVVTSGEVRVGDILPSGKPALAIAQQAGFRVDVAVPASQIAHVRADMLARVKLDAFDWQKYGTVPATVYHVPPDSQIVEGRGAVYVVRMRLDKAELGRDARVKLGMVGHAEIVTGRERLLWLLFRSIREKFDVDG